MRKFFFIILDVLYFAKSFVGSLKASNEYKVENSYGDKSPIIIFPGIWNNWFTYKRLVSRLRGSGHPVYFINNGRRNLWQIDSDKTLDSFNSLIRDYNLENISIIAHSKGALDFLSVYSCSHSDQNKVERLIAVNVPWKGTIFSKFLFVPYINIVRGSHPIFRRVEALSDEFRSKIINIRPYFDNAVIPNSNLVLPGTGYRDIKLDVIGHNRSLGSLEFMDIIAGLVD